MSRRTEPPLDKLFEEIDVDFVGVNKASDELYAYNATDVQVQSTWELPIVIQWPDSVVNFEFCSHPGDISFGIVFVAAPEEGQDLNELEIETVEEMGRVDSNVETISGSFEVPNEGVIFFMWDNNYDWSAIKKISYLIEVRQPSFTYADRARVEQVKPLLKETLEDLESCYVRAADALDLIDHSTANISFMEDQLQTLQRRMESKKKEKSNIEHDISKMHSIIQLGTGVRSGLCMRLLNKHLLSLVLSYLNTEGGSNYVCKYWASVVRDIRVNGPTSGPETPPHLAKMSQGEIRTSLAQIRASQRLREMAKIKDEYDPPKRSSPRKSYKNSGSHTSNNEMLPGATDTGRVAVADVNRDGVVTSSATNSPINNLKLNASTTLHVTDSDSSDLESIDEGSHKKNLRNNKSDNSTNHKTPIGTTVSGGVGDADITTLPRTNSKGSNGSFRISYDNILPAPTRRDLSSIDQTTFTTKVLEARQAASPPVSRKVAVDSNGTPAENRDSASGSTVPVNAVASTTAAESTVTNNTTSINQSVLNNTAGSASTNTATGHNTGVGVITTVANVSSKSSNGRPYKENKLEVPVVAESKKRHRVAGNAGSATISSSSTAKVGHSSTKKNYSQRTAISSTKNNADRSSDKNLLMHVKKIRSEQQLTAMLEYLQGGFQKIETLSNEKRRIKKLIRAWNASFEKNNSRYPTSSERKGHLRELYEEYHQVSLALRIRTEKMDDTMKSVGLTKESFEQLREQKQID